MKSLVFFISVSLATLAVAMAPDLVTMHYASSLADQGESVELARKPTPPIGAPTGQTFRSTEDLK